MTHTLHPEIEKAIKETVEAAYEIHQAEAGKPFRGILHGIIIDNLGKYLLPPSQHLKDEPNYDAACMYVVANGLNITAEDVKGILKAAKVEDNDNTNQRRSERSIR